MGLLVGGHGDDAAVGPVRVHEFAEDAADPRLERGEGRILPALSGPFVIDGYLSEHAVRLADAVTEVPYHKGAGVSVARLVAFNFPYDSIFQERLPAVGEELELHEGDHVAIKLKLKTKPRVYIARILQAYEAGELLQIQLYEVDAAAVFGPWARRQWKPIADAVHASIQEVLCKVVLKDDALTQESLTKLEAFGIDLSNPRRDRTLPLPTLS